MKPTLKQLDYLIALKNEGSFSKAAEYCFVTQSTLSAGIKELEATLAHTLVDRSSRNIALTSMGEEICEQALKISQNVDELVSLTKKGSAPLCGTLRLGVIPTVAPYLLPEILPSLQDAFPNLELQLFEDMTERSIEQLQRRKIDLLLMAFPYEADGIDHQIIFEEEFIIAAPHGRYKNKTITTDFLDNEPVLLLADGHCLRDHALQACKLQKPSQRKTFSATSLQTLIQMVSAGYGITLLPDMAANKCNLPGNIDLLHFKSPRPTRQIGLAWRRGDTRANDYKILAAHIEKLQKP